MKILTSEPASATPQPSGDRGRIVLLDVIRGFALMGMFFVHMAEYFELYWLHPVESPYKDMIFWLFGGKSYAIFALLFGISFFIVFDKKVHGTMTTVQVLRKFLLLLVIGTIHSFYYSGDILQVLALTGFFLLLLISLPDFALLGLAFLLLLQLPLIIYHNAGIAIPSQPKHWSLFAEIYKTYAHGNFAEVIWVNIDKGPLAKWNFLFESGRIFTITGISLLGCWLGRTGIFKMYMNNKKICVLIFSFCSLAYFLGSTFFSEAYSGKDWVIQSIAESYMNLLFIFASVSGICLSMQYAHLKKIGHLLSACGKMSLSLYITQSLIFVPFYYGFGFGAYSFIGITGNFVLALAAWVVQVYLANLWFKYFNYGPFEWLWRVGTYWNRNIRIRKTTSHLDIAQAGARAS